MFEGQVPQGGAAALITVTEPQRGLSERLLDVPGGFLWWYVDMIDAAGSGFVMIWSYGLPFLPGLASAARRGEPVVPRMRPSLNLSVYDRGELVCYLLQEYAPEEATWSPERGEWRFGASTMRVWREEGEVKLSAALDCALPGDTERLRGQIELSGVARRAGFGEAAVDPHHDWTPLMGPAQGTAKLEHGSRRWELQGRAYHDRNGGVSPLHDLGFKSWIWGRLAFADAELIYYILWPTDGGEPTAIGLRIDREGKTERWDGLRAKMSDKRRSWAGRPWWEQVELSTDSGMSWLKVKTRAVVDHGPFYLRFILDGWTPGMAGPGASGIGEACWPDRVDLARHRPLVQMRVHQDGGETSMWNPLFTGPREGRLSRLLQHWRGVTR